MILFMFALSNIESKEKSYYNWYRFSIMLVNIKPYLFILGASSLSVKPETPNDSRSRSLDTFRKRRTLPSKAANCINSLCSPWWLLVMHTIISRTFASTDTNDCWFHNSREKKHCEILTISLFKLTGVGEPKTLQNAYYDKFMLHVSQFYKVLIMPSRQWRLYSKI